MFDWGKLIPVVLQRKTSVILAVCVAIIAFVPIEALDPLRQKYSIELALVGVFAVSVIIVQVVWWLKERVEMLVTFMRIAKWQKN